MYFNPQIMNQPVYLSSDSMNLNAVDVENTYDGMNIHTVYPSVHMCELTLLDHLRASSCSCLAATIMGSLSTSPTFCSGNSSSFSSGGGGRGGGTSPSGSGGFGGACSSLTYRKHEIKSKSEVLLLKCG